MKICFSAGKLMKQFGNPPFVKEPPLFQLTPRFLRNFFMTPLFVQILKTRTPLILGGEETMIAKYCEASSEVLSSVYCEASKSLTFFRLKFRNYVCLKVTTCTIPRLPRNPLNFVLSIDAVLYQGFMQTNVLRNIFLYFVEFLLFLWYPFPGAPCFAWPMSFFFLPQMRGNIKPMPNIRVVNLLRSIYMIY